jgi:hypothetical protein
MAKSREFLMLVREQSLNVPVASPVAGTDSIRIRLTDGNAFNMASNPIWENIAYGGGLAIDAEAISDHYELKGSLKTKLYPSQIGFLLGWATTRINSAQNSPWVTTERPGDLASVSAYHAIQRGDGTFLRKRFGGCKPTSVTIDCSRGSTTAGLTMDIQGSQAYSNAFEPAGGANVDPDATEFPEPVDADFPRGPYTFKQSSGLFTLAGGVRTMYEDLSIKFTNAIDGRWFESSGLLLNQFCGRMSTLDASFYFQSTPDFRSAMEALTSQVCSIGFNNGITGQHLTIVYNGQNKITALPYDTPLNAAYLQKLTLKNLYDFTAGEDFHFTMT